MYKKAIGVLAVLNLIFLFCFLCVQEISQNRLTAIPVCQMKMDERVLASYEGSTLGIVEAAVSGQRVVDVREMAREEQESAPEAEQLEKDDMDILMRIVEAEAGNQDINGKLLVANVVLNRVHSDIFPDSVTDVVLQNSNGIYQFSPVLSGSIWKVRVSEETGEAVGRALEGEDISGGALYFAARRYADPGTMRWFDEHLTYLFEYGGHEFYR